MKCNPQKKYSPVLVVIVIITGLLLTTCSSPKTYTIGVINTLPALDSTMQGFKEGMAELDYTEGENITYIYKGTTTETNELDSMAQSLVASNVDLILSITTPATQAAQRATANTNIPVVFVLVTDPVNAGLVDSLKQPGGNITGITFGVQEKRRLEWLVQIVPTIKQIYVPYNPKDQSAVLVLEMMRATAPELGVELITQEVHDPEEVTVAFENIPEEADAIFFLPDSVVSSRILELTKAAIDLKLPSSGANAESVKDGLLTSYGVEQIASGKQAARLVDQILRGAKPADLPVETGEIFLTINLQTAEAIGLDIPDKILLQADTIIR